MITSLLFAVFCWRLYFPRQHKHRWRDTRINPFWIVTEQRCACGACRHLADMWDVMPIDQPVRWTDGPHPLA